VRTLVLLGMLAMGQAVQAQGYPARMTISAPEVLVRSGPSEKSYPTSKLKYGDSVWVQNESKDQPGWLAITPPPGTFSWINAKQVKQVNANTGYVEAEEGGAVVLPGSSVSGEPPNQKSVKIPNGSQVLILGSPITADGNTWLPIQSWITEVRFIPGQAVQTRQLASGAAATNNAPGAPGRLASMSQNAWTPAQAPGHPAQMAQTTSWATGQSAFSPQPTPSPQNSAYPPQWSQVGVLRRAFDTGGQPTYALEDYHVKGRVLIYVTCAPGTTLRDYVVRTVAVYASISYHSDDFLRTHVMMASHVAAY